MNWISFDSDSASLRLTRWNLSFIELKPNNQVFHLRCRLEPTCGPVIWLDRIYHLPWTTRTLRACQCSSAEMFSERQNLPPWWLGLAGSIQQGFWWIQTDHLWTGEGEVVTWPLNKQLRDTGPDWTQNFILFKHKVHQNNQTALIK